MKTMLEQLQSMMIPAVLLDPEMVQHAVAAHHGATTTNISTLWTDWSLKTGFTTGTLFLRADSWRPMPPIYDHFKKSPLSFGAKENGKHKWELVNRKFTKDHRIRLYQKAGDSVKLGWAQFDGDVWIPILLRHRFGDTDPIMSLTPNECISVKAGARFAKGHVVITGLGLGYLLWLVSHRPSVKSITLIEIDQDLVNVVMPLLSPHLNIQPNVIIADCRNLLGGMKGDVLLLDHFDDYGSNSDWVRDEWSTGFTKTWIWG